MVCLWFGRFILFYYYIVIKKKAWIGRESCPYIKGKGNLLTQGYYLSKLIILDKIGTVDALHLIIIFISLMTLMFEHYSCCLCLV